VVIVVNPHLRMMVGLILIIVPGLPSVLVIPLRESWLRRSLMLDGGIIPCM
jgi:hypothetical protein